MNSDTPLLSIIVPVYNAETKLSKLFESITKQDFDDFELLLVNDASSDNSLAVCRAFAEKNSNIHIFCHTTNKGPSAARETGFRNCKGKYVLFADADDWFSDNAWGKWVICAEQTHADVVICDFIQEESAGAWNISFGYDSCQQDFVLKDMLKRKLGWMLWNKLFRRDLWGKYNVPFPPLKMGEDFVQIMAIFQHPVHWEYIPEPLYHYNRRNEDSLCTIHHCNHAAMASYSNDTLNILHKYILPEHQVEILPVLEVDFALSELHVVNISKAEFRRKYGELKNSYQNMKMPFLCKVYLFLAFNISPGLCYRFLSFLKKGSKK